MTWNPARALGQAEESLPSVADAVSMFTRQRRIALIACCGVFLMVLVYGLVLSDRYEAQMEILVAQSQLRRADPVLTGIPNAQPIVNQQGSTGDEALNSEIALLRSDDVLRQVVRSTGLDTRTGIWYGAVENLWDTARRLHLRWALRLVSDALPMFRPPTQDQLTAKAVGRLAGKLRIEIIKLSDVISISYRSGDPEQAALVLRTLGDAYLKQHAVAHRPPGELQFFEKQTTAAHAALEQSEQNLVNFTQSSGVADGSRELEDVLRRMSDTKAAQDQVKAEMAGTLQQIDSLQQQSKRIPARTTTVLKSSDNGVLIQQLKSSLLDLQMKRTQLLTQFKPTYPLVTQVNKQIEQAQAALADAQNSHVAEETTDRDPAYEMVRESLTRARVNLADLQARSASLAAEYGADQLQARTLQRQRIEQQDLMRRQKTAEDNYLLLLQKQQEAQIAEAMDRRGILNVTIVQGASVPALPVHPAWWYLLCGGFLSLLAALAGAIGADRLDPTLRTAHEVEMVLQAPVLVTLPLRTKAVCLAAKAQDLL